MCRLRCVCSTYDRASSSSSRGLLKATNDHNGIRLKAAVGLLSRTLGVMGVMGLAEGNTELVIQLPENQPPKPACLTEF